MSTTIRLFYYYNGHHTILIRTFIYSHLFRSVPSTLSSIMVIKKQLPKQALWFSSSIGQIIMSKADLFVSRTQTQFAYKDVFCKLTRNNQRVNTQ